MSRLIGFMVVLALCASVVGVAVAAKGKQPGKTHSAKIVKTKKASAASVKGRSVKAVSRARGATDPEEASSESSGDNENDGVDAGGDHQCPPDCAPGEKP